MEEVWKDILEYEGYYQVSNTGKIKRLAGKRCLNSRILKPGKNKGNYSFVILCKNCKKTSMYIHRLVALSFIPNIENKKEINHIDCNKSNNIVSNLEWCTHKENSKHSFDNGLNTVVRRKDVIENRTKVLRKLSDLTVKEIKKLSETGLNYSEISKKLSVRHSTVWFIINKKNYANVYSETKELPKNV